MGSQGNDLLWRVFSLPKRGHTAEEYEDAFAANARAGKFAIADGASESAFAQPWAKLLVDAFVKSPEHSSWLQRARQRWQRMFENRPMAWYAEAKFAEGAFATWVGVVINEEDGHYSWKAYAVGDCCLFLVRNDVLSRAFPIRYSRGFTIHPDLLGSRKAGDTASKVRRQRLTGAWQPGDRLLLMTDALAQWFLAEHEKRHCPWRTLAAIADERDFGRFVETARTNHKLRNDDVTLMTIESAKPLR